MAERVLVLILAGIALFAVNAPRVRRSTRRERWILIAFAVPALYLSLMFITDNDWPNVHDLANGSVGRIAHYLVKWFEHI